MDRTNAYKGALAVASGVLIAAVSSSSCIASFVIGDIPRGLSVFLRACDEVC